MNVEDYRKHPEKWLPVTWQSAPDRHFSSEIRIDAANRTGVLAAVAAAIASTDTNIDHVSVETRDIDTSVLVFEGEGARSQAPRAHHAHHPHHAGRGARHPHDRRALARPSP